MIDTPSVKIPFAKTSVHYLNISYDLKSWLLTTDHKRIAILYLITLSSFFGFGALLAGMLQVELISAPAEIFEADIYNRLFSLHGVVMTFYFLVPSVFAVFGGFLVPLMIGTRKLAYPRMFLISWYVYILGGLTLGLMAMLGGIDTGWDFVIPYTTVYSQDAVPFMLKLLGVLSPHSTISGGFTNLLALLGILFTGLSSILVAFNLLVTIHKNRAVGLTWYRLPLFVWSIYATSVIVLAGLPALIVTVLVLGLEQLSEMGLVAVSPGDNLLLVPHLFWLYAHSSVYVMIVPAIGVVSEIVSAFAKKQIYNYKYAVYTILAIAALTLLNWGSHMLVSGQPFFSTFMFALISFLLTGAFAAIILNLTATFYNGSISFEAPMIFAYVFIGLFTIATVSQLILSMLSSSLQLDGTYFSTGYMHYLLVGGGVTGFMAAVHFWWPKITGRMYSEMLGRISAGLIFAGANMAFFPQLLLGYAGLPQRVYAYPIDYQWLQEISAEGGLILGIGLLIPGLYFIWSMFMGQPAPSNPWDAKGLEWTVTSPPPTDNFAQLPVVTEETYAYSIEAGKADEVDIVKEAAVPVEPDDLTKIEGIGPKISEILQAAKIETFDQLSKTEVVGLKQILAEAGSRFKLSNPATWPEQAALAAAGKWDELETLQDKLHSGRRR